MEEDDRSLQVSSAKMDVSRSSAISGHGQLTALANCFHEAAQRWMAAYQLTIMAAENTMAGRLDEARRLMGLVAENIRNAEESVRRAKETAAQAGFESK